ncbi:MAG: OFA family MFS transporter [candidate division WOR-3 bacterium]|nr:OFA family MFS transporter [candidate division WOR-3 bacterium]
MKDEKLFNRWWIVFAAIIIQLCLGAIYAWSVFRKPLEQQPLINKSTTASEIIGFDTLLVRGDGEEILIRDSIEIRTGDLWKLTYNEKEKKVVTKINSIHGDTLKVKRGLSPTQASLPFSFVLIFFALATIIGGRWQDKAGPKIAIAGGILLGLGMILASFAKTLLAIVLFYGVISGIGIGIAYVCPISAGVKWFPDKRGLITGLSVAGFGAGALIVGPVARSLIDSVGIFNTFRILGIVFLILVFIGGMILRNPPSGYKPAGWTAPTITATSKIDFSVGEMLSTGRFYLIWLMYFIGCACGLMVIGQTSPIGQELAQYSKETAAFGVSLLAIFNAMGRIFWGRVSDSFGRMKTLFLIFLICGLGILSYNLITGFQSWFWVGISLVGLCFGGYLALFPAITADLFGTKNVGVNYGFVFTAYGVGGLLSNIFAPRVKELTGGYTFAFIVTGVLCLIASILTFLVKSPKN